MNRSVLVTADAVLAVYGAMLDAAVARCDGEDEVWYLERAARAHARLPYFEPPFVRLDPHACLGAAYFRRDDWDRSWLRSCLRLGSKAGITAGCTITTCSQPFEQLVR